ncbi:MAG: DEAD/DEAH box helicase [Bacteroidetes bacterium]|nr:DEAD/DEAH box helicase [Bacteroidota bacterium]
MTFNELGLSQPVLKALNDLGFTNPTPIQQQTIPLLSKQKNDLVALAQTGTGKTAAFSLPLLNQIDLNETHIQALVLAPTRELCIQISNDIKNFSKYLTGFSVTSVYGGARIDGQIKEIKRGTTIIVATPGRLVDLIDRKAINLGSISTVVLDEADEMLNMGFKEDLDIILNQTPENKNVWLFSATMPAEVDRIARRYMKTPLELSTGKRNEAAENIKHIYFEVHSKDRYLALKRIADYYPEIFGLVFCRTKAETQDVAEKLIKDGYSADALHGDLSQSQRDFVMKRFRNRTIQMLVATDVAARGIDVNDITHVINYNLPEDVENYTHRSGRTARAGKSGTSITIVSSKDKGKIKDIERIIKRKFEKQSVPNGLQVCEKQLFHLVHKLHKVEVKTNEIEQFLPAIYEELKDLSKEELIKRFVSEEFNRFYTYYETAPDLNIGSSGSNEKGDGYGRTTRFFVNMGSMDGFNFKSLKEFLAESVSVDSKMVFNADVKASFSFFETESRFVDTFLALNSNDAEFNGRKIKVEVSSRKSSDGRGKREGKGDKHNYERQGSSRSRNDKPFRRDKNKSSGFGKSGFGKKPRY